jgi:hypothetical protein
LSGFGSVKLFSDSTNVRESFFIALVSEPKVSLEEPSFQVETDSPSNDQEDVAPPESDTKIEDPPKEEILNDKIEPSTSSNDVEVV